MDAFVQVLDIFWTPLHLAGIKPLQDNLLPVELFVSMVYL